jgi:large subunit ribosomal protein L32
MGLQKSRKSRSKRDMRRANDKLTNPTLSTDPLTGETHRRHHMSPDGYYKGRQIIEPKEDNSSADEE